MARSIPWTMLAVAALAGLAIQNQRLSSRLEALDGRLAALAAPPTEAPSCGARTGDAGLARQVADEVVRRQQLAAATAQHGPAAAAVEAEPAAVVRSEPSPHPDEAEALAEAGDVLDQAVGRGRLTRDDVLAMRTQLAAVDGAALDPLRSRIAQLVNAQRLAIEDPRFVYP